MYEIEKNFDYEVNCTCPLPCDEYQYHYTLSTAEWPSINFEVTPILVNQAFISHTKQLLGCL